MDIHNLPKRALNIAATSFQFIVLTRDLMLLMFLNFFNYPFFLDIQDECLVLGHSIQK